jgi:carboxypeptidase family protein
MADSVRWAAAVWIVVLCALSVAAGQIIEFREVDGKSFQCIHSGLSSDLNDCGFRSDWYAYVFVGSISAILPSSDKDEKTLQIAPEEIFHGNPPTPLTVLTSQGACLPKLAVGDRWLFFLRKEADEPVVLDYGGNDSRPVAQAQEQVETLRRLKAMGDFGLLRGNVMHGPSYSDRKPVPGVRVVATRSTDRAKYFTTTDAEGDYEFQPVPVGSYELAAETVGPTYVGNSALKITSGVCWKVTLWKSPAARLSGHIRRSDGSALPKTEVLIMRDDYSWFTTQESDANGYFQEDSLRAGKYVVGISLPGEPPWRTGGCAGACLNEIPPVSLYYPGMLGRSNALVIDLATDEKRDELDFTLPPQ